MATMFRNAVSGPSRLAVRSTLAPVPRARIVPSFRSFSTSLGRLAPGSQSHTQSSSSQTQSPSSSSESPFSTLSGDGDGAARGSPRPLPFEFKFQDIPRPQAQQVDPDAWWRAISEQRANGFVTKSYHSRSFSVRSPARLNVAIRQMNRVVRDTGLRRKVKMDEFHEVPSAKRVRLKSERHRRKFKAMVREKVKEVNLFTRRGG